MYIFIKNIFRFWFESLYGLEKWDELLRTNQLTNEHYETNMENIDTMMVQIIENFDKVADQSWEDIEDQFGLLFLKITLLKQHSNLVELLSTNLFDWVNSFDSLYAYLILEYSDLYWPSICASWCNCKTKISYHSQLENKTESNWLEYYDLDYCQNHFNVHICNNGLFGIEIFLSSIIKAIALEMFDMTIKIKKMYNQGSLICIKIENMESIRKQTTKMCVDTLLNVPSADNMRRSSDIPYDEEFSKIKIKFDDSINQSLNKKNIELLNNEKFFQETEVNNSNDSIYSMIQCKCPFNDNIMNSGRKLKPSDSSIDNEEPLEISFNDQTYNLTDFNERISDKNYIPLVNKLVYNNEFCPIESSFKYNYEPIIIDMNIIHAAFPFHVIFNRKMQILSIGSSMIHNISYQMTNKSNKLFFTDIFKIIRPRLGIDLIKNWDIIKYFSRVSIYIQIINNANSQNDNLIFQGQLKSIANSKYMILICSPKIDNLNQMTQYGLYLSDIPIHDATRDLILMTEQSGAEAELWSEVCQKKNQIQKAYKQLEEERTLTDKLLFSILPTHVANKLRYGRKFEARRYENTTITFIGIVNFNQICAYFNDQTSSSRNPKKVVDLLNVLFTEFDTILDKYPDIYKVETVGDIYMCASGVPKETAKHAEVSLKFSLELIKRMQDLSKIPDTINNKCVQTNIRQNILENNKPETYKNPIDMKNDLLKSNYNALQNVMDSISSSTQFLCNSLDITIGIHSGESVAGVIGRKRFRYCLFGNTINIASRTKSTGIPGKINLTEKSLRLIDAKALENIKIIDRGTVNMKGVTPSIKCYYIE